MYIGNQSVTFDDSIKSGLILAGEKSGSGILRVYIPGMADFLFLYAKSGSSSYSALGLMIGERSGTIYSVMYSVNVTYARYKFTGMNIAT